MEPQAVYLAVFQATLILIGLFFMGLSVSRPWSLVKGWRYGVSIALGVITIVILGILSILSLIFAMGEAGKEHYVAICVILMFSLALLFIEFLVVSGVCLSLKKPPKTEDMP